MSEPIVKGSKGPPRAADIKAYWEATTTPGTRTVCARMIEDGFDTSPSSVARCVKSGFLPCAWETTPAKYTRPKKSTPKANAKRQVEHVAPPAADPQAIAAAVVEQIQQIENLSPTSKTRFDELMTQEPQDIIERTRKVDMVLGLILKEEMAQSPKMMMLQPDKAAKLFDSLAATSIVVPVAPTKAPESSRDGSDARVVEGREVKTLSASAQAIADFRRKNGMAA